MTVRQKLFDELLLKLEMTMISQYSGSGLVPSGSKQLPVPTSTESRYMASPGHIIMTPCSDIELVQHGLK